MSELTQITEFTDYRAFLRQLYEAEKSLNPGTNLAKFSERFGKSPSLLRHILAGTRNLTVANIHEMADSLRFSPSERSYFEAVVLENQAKSPSEKAHYLSRVRHLGEELAPRMKVRLPATRLVSRWYFGVLLNYVCDFTDYRETGLATVDKEELTSLSEKLGVTQEEVSEVISALNDLPNFKVDAEGNVHVVIDKSSGANAHILNLVDLTREIGKRIPQDFHKRDSFFSATTATLTEEEFQALKARYKSMLDEIIAQHTSRTKGAAQQSIYQVNLFSYPVLSGLPGS